MSLCKQQTNIVNCTASYFPDIAGIHQIFTNSSSMTAQTSTEWTQGIYSVSHKNPPWRLVQFFQNGWEFFNQILHAYYAFPSTLDYALLFNYLQLWRNYAILSKTIQFKSCAQNVHHRPKCTLAFSDIFPKQLAIFSPNFTCLLNVHMYARVQFLFNYL